MVVDLINQYVTVIVTYWSFFLDVLKLRKQIDCDYFDYQALSCALAGSGHIRRDIGRLIKAGHINRVKKGLYIWGDDLRRGPYSKQVLSNLIFGPSYVSLESALSFYGLIPERVEVTTAVTPKRNKFFETPVGTFEYCYLQAKTYPWGITWKKAEGAGSFLIASPEKAILDYIAIRVKKWEDELSSENFLYEDLRFDESEFKKINFSTMKKLSSYYKSKAVGIFVKEVGRG